METNTATLEGNAKTTEFALSLNDQALGQEINKLLGNGAEPPAQRLTELGTPCAASWDTDWIAQVDAAEKRLGHAICGARMPSGKPCELSPNHANGRCRFHGGFALTGAQPGNRNAILHGLYSRRLRVCGTSCTRAHFCPCVGPDVDKLPLTDRPTCPYEQTQYNAVFTDAMDRISRNPNHDALDIHTAHNLALMMVIMDRAAVGMRNSPMGDVTGPYLDAFVKVSREYQRLAAMLKAPKPIEPDLHDFAEHATRVKTDTDLGLGPYASKVITGETQRQARRYVRQAIESASQGDSFGAYQAGRNAVAIDESHLEQWQGLIAAAYRPNGTALPEPEAQRILNRLLPGDGRGNEGGGGEELRITNCELPEKTVEAEGQKQGVVVQSEKEPKKGEKRK